MKYLVNRETKEHRIATEEELVLIDLFGANNETFMFVEADDEGWIPWSGGECPLPASKLAEVKLQDGQQGRFESIDMLTHRSWQKWNCGGDIIAYRPILSETAEKEQTEEEWNGYIDADDDAASVFDRLKSAIAASESIPSIIAEIDDLLPEGYCVTRFHVQPVAEQPAEDMSDWRNWREGDIIEVIENEGIAAFKVGDKHKILKTNRLYVYIGTPSDGWIPRHFRFHSRPAKVAE